MELGFCFVEIESRQKREKEFCFLSGFIVCAVVSWFGVCVGEGEVTERVIMNDSLTSVLVAYVVLNE